MEIPLFNDIVIIFILSISVIFVCHRIGIPPIVGFLITGVLAGPHGLELVGRVHDVEILAEIGVVLLLFTIGLEFSLKDLLRIKRAVFLGGILQVVLTIGITFITTQAFNQSTGTSIFFGFLVALSSTAIVLKQLQDKGEIDTPHGSVSLAILIFQDIIIVPMLLFTPLLAGAAEQVTQALLILLLKGMVIIAVVMLSATFVVPRLLYHIAQTRSRELFLLSVVAICFGVAWVTFSLGLSLALGAFLAGLIISESEYSYHAIGNIVPLRDIFTSFFFVSIGMLLDLSFLFKQPVLIISIVLGTLFLKTVTAGLATLIMGLPLRTILLVGISLCQVGEFSFVLSKAGVEYGLLGKDTYQLFLAVSILTMAVTPLIMNLMPSVAEATLRLRLPEWLETGFFPVAEGKNISKKKIRFKDHLIIIGFGLNGKNVARASKIAGIPYCIIEMNPETIRRERSKGEPIFYGDALQEAVLEHAGIKEARVLVTTVSDPVVTRRIVTIARNTNPKIYIITRTRFIQEMKTLSELGADEIIPEEFETSVEIFTRVLTKYLIPRDEIERFIAEIRSDGYKVFRSSPKKSASIHDLAFHLSDMEITSLRVDSSSSLVGQTISEIGFRKNYQVTLLAIRRDSYIISNPGGDTIISAHDIIIVLGLPTKIAEITNISINASENISSSA
jgi:CPA2 family monovalent cation:H+ antiporter-2